MSVPHLKNDRMTEYGHFSENPLMKANIESFPENRLIRSFGHFSDDSALLHSLESRGVLLLLDPGAPSGLRYVAERGVLTPADREAIREAAPSLRALLEARARPSAGPITRPIEQRGQVAPPARFASSGSAPIPALSADLYPGPEAPQGMLHAWMLREWQRQRGESLDPALVEEALAAYADPGEGVDDSTQEEPDAVPAWLRACAPPPGWTQAEEAAHRRRWANERGAPIHRREEAGHAPA